MAALTRSGARKGIFDRQGCAAEGMHNGCMALLLEKQLERVFPGGGQTEAEKRLTSARPAPS
jgi:hypothetical protein